MYKCKIDINEEDFSIVATDCSNDCMTYLLFWRKSTTFFTKHETSLQPRTVAPQTFRVDMHTLR